MSVLQRLLGALRDDVGALLPGSGVAFTRDAVLRWVMYIALLFFLVRLFFPFTGSPEGRRYFDADPGGRMEEPAPQRREPEITDPMQI